MLNASNDARTRLSSNVNGLDTVVAVDSASDFPSAPFLITVNRNRENMEIMRVTEVNGENLAVERAQEGTTASEHLQGSIVENNFTAGTYHSLLDELANKESEIEDLENELNAHKAETVSKVVRITEPYDQMITTTVNLGFTPKWICIDAVISGRGYTSTGFLDSGGRQHSRTFHNGNGRWYILNDTIRFTESSEDRMVGSVEIINDGIKIEWDYTGSLEEAKPGDERRLIISATTHGDD